jgi:hypothetical protein
MHDHLGRYLNDHLAGSVAALEMLAHVHSAERSLAEREFLTWLQSEIEDDRQVLRDLIDRLDVGESAPRKMLAWIAEQVSEWKLHVDDRGGGAFRWFEALEALSLGVEGKRLLWTALAAAAQQIPQLQGIAYDDLQRRAASQRERIETLRDQAAREALRQPE